MTTIHFILLYGVIAQIITEINMPKRSPISIEVGKMFCYWKITKEPNGDRVLCLCTGCNKTEKEVLIGKLRRGNSRSCGCKQQDLTKQAFKEKYGADNPNKTVEVQDKKKRTMIQRYGVEYSGQSKELIEKREVTNLKKYGSKTNLNTLEFKEKSKQTCLEKYGVEHHAQNEEVKQKGIKTRLGKYGTEWYQQTEEYKERYTKTCFEKYGVSNAHLAPEVNQKRIQTNIDKYGVENYTQAEGFAQKAKITTMKKYNVESYAQTQNYKNNQRQHYRLLGGQTIAELSREYNINNTTLNNVYNDYGEEALFEYCKQNVGTRRIFSTEIAMIELLKDDFENLTKYDRFPSDFKCRFKPDFRLEKNGKILYLNIDGLFDHSEIGRSTKGKKDYHLNIREVFDQNSYNIFQIREDELRDRPKVVRSIVLNYFGIFEKKYNARSLEIREVKSEQARLFFEANHLMGFYSAVKSYGLYSDDELVSCLSVRTTKDHLEIARFGGKLSCSIRGGFSKLLKHAQKIHNPSRLVSFCDLRYCTGKSYKDLGFELEGTTLGWRWTDKYQSFNRLKCKANMDDRNLSQKKHAEELKWYKIYDAGQAKYVKNVEQSGKI